MKNRNQHKRKAFTLVEIMIVVAIIGILLGIAMPAWQAARTKSYQTVRARNCSVIDRAKETWIQEKGRAANALATQSDLTPEYIKTFPTDPNGSYQINDGVTPCVFIPN